MEKVTIYKTDMQRVNSIIKLQNDLITQYELYQNYIENQTSQSLIDTLKEEIKSTKKAIDKIKSLRIAELIANG